jgi:hypothetical protein
MPSIYALKTMLYLPSIEARNSFDLHGISTAFDAIGEVFSRMPVKLVQLSGRLHKIGDDFSETAPPVPQN